MAKQKPPTPDELLKIKEHFSARGYGVLSDHTASVQTHLLKKIRQEAGTNG